MRAVRLQDDLVARRARADHLHAEVRPPFRVVGVIEPERRFIGAGEDVDDVARRPRREDGLVDGRERRLRRPGVGVVPLRGDVVIRRQARAAKRHKARETHDAK